MYLFILLISKLFTLYTYIYIYIYILIGDARNVYGFLVIKSLGKWLLRNLRCYRQGNIKINHKKINYGNKDQFEVS
jgi:hypothetical protein